ncbi:caffeoylshikimate esterase-like isoform X2 [Cucurbita pepo subsp. pepo]|uniref:caffeoylshikimate esterase-like isoform X1 n=1 Tax=Cucurbita pepo subsp. pepo TaxID=3664 RepID=UPI000C9D634D|nr:caffeoylshikimate esterase-like isoform X1 [Cucurbita pepo subsp. pepo]XP_023538759.1 caffeoylshikimate esterase-like isoform X2 [Cucurbita pepo subsp. pepo]
MASGLGFRPSDLSFFSRKFASPINHRENVRLPFTPLRKMNPEQPMRWGSGCCLVVAAKRPPIDGVPAELNKIASQKLDSAPARRRVRSAFIEIQQQLDHCLFKMAPAGISTEEWYECNSRGLNIFCKRWFPDPDVHIKGAVCFCHGYGGTCTFFFDGTARHIAASGYAVYAMDYPGFGLSEGLHGYIPSFDQLVDDVIEQYKKFKGRPELKGLPHFILGQSMGGAITLKIHLKEPNLWDGLVLVAPMCKIADDVKPPEPVLKVLSLMSNVMPKAKLLPNVDFDELALREAKKRKLAVYNVISYEDRMRVKTAMELLKATDDIEKQLEKVSSPLLILHGAADKVTDPKISQFLYEKASSKDKTLKLYEDGFHCILEGEPDERIFTVLNDIIHWLDSRCPSTKQ